MNTELTNTGDTELENQFNVIQKHTREIAKRLNINLELIFDEELYDPEGYDKDEETKGLHYKVIDQKNNCNEDDDPFLQLGISVNKKFQFFHDATPFSTSLNTEEEKRLASMALNDCPSPIDQLTLTIYNEIIEAYKIEIE